MPSDGFARNSIAERRISCEKHRDAKEMNRNAVATHGCVMEKLTEALA